MKGLGLVALSMTMRSRVRTTYWNSEGGRSSEAGARLAVETAMMSPSTTTVAAMEKPLSWLRISRPRGYSPGFAPRGPLEWAG